MHARMATFSIPPEMEREQGEQIVEEVRRRITEQGGPDGVQRVMILVDMDKRIARNVTFFDTKEHMDAAESYFENMTPVAPDSGGRRTEVAHFEVAMDLEVAATT